MYDIGLWTLAANHSSLYWNIRHPVMFNDLKTSNLQMMALPLL